MGSKVYILNVPAGTTKLNPAMREVHLNNCKVVRIDIGFLDGCNNYVSVIIRDGLHQIMPDIEGQDLSWNAHIFSFPYDIIVPDVGKTFNLIGWSPLAIYPHDIYFWFITEDAQQITIAQTLLSFLTKVPTREQIP